MRRVTKLLACALASTLLATGTPRATTIIHVPFDEMVRRSGLIVRATVIEMHVEVRPARGRSVLSRRPETGVPPLIAFPDEEPTGTLPTPVGVGIGSDGGAMPFTHITLAIEEAIKGAASSSILKLRMPGGPLGDRQFEVVGLPRFAVGRRYYLFLRPDCETVGDFIVGVDQGFFRIERDPSTGADLLADNSGILIAGVESNFVIRVTGVKRHAAPLAPTQLTRLVRSVPRWDEPPASTPHGGRP